MMIQASPVTIACYCKTAKLFAFFHRSTQRGLTIVSDVSTYQCLTSSYALIAMIDNSRKKFSPSLVFAVRSGQVRKLQYEIAWSFGFFFHFFPVQSPIFIPRQVGYGNLFTVDRVTKWHKLNCTHRSATGGEIISQTTSRPIEAIP